MKKILTTAGLCLALTFGGAAHAGDHEGKFKRGIPQEVLAKLPRDKQELVKKSFEEGKKEHEANRDKMKGLYKELKEIETAPEFNKEAFLAKHKQIEEAKAQAHASKIARKAELFSKLSAEERKVLSDAKRKHKGKGKGKEDAKPTQPAPEQQDESAPAQQ
ncbi:MAG: periplasmic heavy metal sensor [Alphaproteobacteria bacterium]|nr:periplasmic heavy metal sensor [Alphaproteobacteria bacterium]